MNTFVSTAVVKANKTTSTNGMVMYHSTTNDNLDFYARSGTIQFQNLIESFIKALNEDENLAIRNLLHMRDIRTGKGIRNNSRTILRWLAENKPNYIIRSQIVQRFVDVGRWDDLFEILKQSNKQPSNFVLNFIVQELQKPEPNPLLCKWLPRNDKKTVKNRKTNYDIISKLIRERLNLSPKAYRKLLVANTKVVETQMCSQQWKDINFQHVPSQAFRIYQKAFAKHTPDLFTAFLNKVENGEAKINAGAVWPHEILKEVTPDNSGRYRTANKFTPAQSAQWNSLTDFINSPKQLLPLIDVSGSMGAAAYGSFTCATIAVALGLYTAERNKSAFKNMFLTFESQPSLAFVKDTMSLSEKVNTITSQPWGGSTNLAAAFDKILSHAVNHNVSQKDMPEMLVVFTDMGFNSYYNDSYNVTAMRVLKSKYSKAGYNLPQVVWWNLSGKAALPVLEKDTNTCIVSGFSPSNFSAILDTDQFTPLNVMKTALLQDKYNWQ